MCVCFFKMFFHVFLGVVNLQKNMYQMICFEDTGCLFAPDLLDYCTVSNANAVDTSKDQIFIL